MVNYLDKWYQIDELIKLVNFVGVDRPGFVCESSYPVQMLDIPMIDLSSTHVRDRLKKKQTVRYIIPEAVREYIEELNLYHA